MLHQTYLLQCMLGVNTQDLRPMSGDCIACMLPGMIVLHTACTWALRTQHRGEFTCAFRRSKSATSSGTTPLESLPLLQQHPAPPQQAVQQPTSLTSGNNSTARGWDEAASLQGASRATEAQSSGREDGTLTRPSLANAPVAQADEAAAAKG